MIFNSILYPMKPEADQLSEQMPKIFSDLFLDAVVNAITEDLQAYQLETFFYTPLQDEEAILYRQEVFRDLENETVYKSITAFAERMISIRRYLGVAEKSYDPYHSMGWHLEAALEYCDAIKEFVAIIAQAEIQSQGLQNFEKWLVQYHQSPFFGQLHQEAHDLHTQLKSIQYNVIVKDLSVRVQKYDAEQDYNLIVKDFFSKFEHNEVKNYRIDLVVGSGMNHVEAKILNIVAKLFPEEFSELTEFSEKYPSFIDDVIKNFDREIQFYISYLVFINRIKASGLSFCYPKVSSKDKAIHVNESFDIALADKHRQENKPIICNDFFLQGDERIFIITGANQGGKTTFARMLGQVHYLACLGCPVPGQEAKLFIFDEVFTHFEQEEDIKNLRGKLKDDLVRIHHILDQATNQSIIIMNEIFTSTSLHDARYLCKNILEKIIALDAICVCVTFVDEMASLSKQTVSMVSTVEPDNPAVRTFKVVRRPADGRAYALDIARQHSLTHSLITERIGQ